MSKCQNCVYYKENDQWCKCCVAGDENSENCRKYRSNVNGVPSNHVYLLCKYDRKYVGDSEFIKGMLHYKDGDDKMMADAVWKYWGDVEKPATTRDCRQWLFRPFKRSAFAGDILPCPFCGSFADYCIIGDTPAIVCSKCKAMMRSSTKDGLLTKWNRRKTK